MSTEETQQSDTLVELARARMEITAKATGEKTTQDEDDDYVAPAKKQEDVGETAAEPVVEPEELIKIGDKEFKTQAEAIKYAESLEYDKLVSQAYNEGVKDSLKVNAPQTPITEKEDNFEARFYTDPKGTLKSLKEEAKAEALEAVKAENRKEQLWTTFLSDNPDVDRRDAERILKENWETLGQMSDIPKAMKILAQKTRGYYDEIIERRKPRTELPNKGSQVVSSGNATSSGVTPARSEKPLDFVSELKKLRKNS